MKLGSLFSGYGGLDMAIQAAFPNITTAWVSDFDTGPNKILAHRYPDVPNIGDITAIDWALVEPVDIIAGGFPCQDVSLAGRRAGMTEGTRSNLWGAMRTAIETIRPRYVVAENVRGLLSATANSVSDMEPGGGPLGDGRADNLRALGRVLGDLADLGYDAGWCGIRAADVGAPHGRFRVFIVAEDSLRSGSGGRTVVASDSASEQPNPTADRPDSRSDSSRHREVALLPTPVAQPSGNTPENHLRKKPGRTRVTDLSIMVENGLLATGGQLLPTPRASDGPHGGPNQRGSKGDLMLSSAVHQLLPTPNTMDHLPVRTGDAREKALRRGGETSRRATTGNLREEILNLLPTPRATRGGSHTETAQLLPTPTARDHKDHEIAINPKRPRDRDTLSRALTDLLPTPTASEGNGIGAHGTGGADLRTTIATTDFGTYTPAIERWEHNLGRPAPAPTEPNGKNRPRLSARFVEWMMGLPDGWVTDTPGITRNQQLKALGNGVVPLQCEAALRHLLDLMEGQDK